MLLGWSFMLMASSTLRIHQWASRLINLTSVQIGLWPVWRACSETAPRGLGTNESYIPLVSFDQAFAQVSLFPRCSLSLTLRESCRQRHVVEPGQNCSLIARSVTQVSCQTRRCECLLVLGRGRRASDTPWTWGKPTGDSNPAKGSCLGAVLAFVIFCTKVEGYPLETRTDDRCVFFPATTDFYGALPDLRQDAGPIACSSNISM